MILNIDEKKFLPQIERFLEYLERLRTDEIFNRDERIQMLEKGMVPQDRLMLDGLLQEIRRRNFRKSERARNRFLKRD